MAGPTVRSPVHLLSHPYDHLCLHIGKGLAEHLEVPLPYLLYRAQARYEEDLRGLKDIRGMLAPPPISAHHSVGGAQPSSRRPSSSTGVPPPQDASTSAAPTSALAGRVPPLSIRIPAKAAGGGTLSARALSASGKLATPLGVRVRLNSLTHKSPSKSRPQQVQGYGLTPIHAEHPNVSSSTATLQGIPSRRFALPLRPPSPFSEDGSSDSSDASELIRRKEEEEERNAEERESLEKKLAQLQKTMTTEMVGLVRNPAPADKGKGKEAIRGRTPFPMSAVSAATAGVSGVTTAGSPTKPRSGEDINAGFGHGEIGFAPRNRDHSASVSSASSPQGSVPSIPSPTSPSSPRPIPNRSSDNPSHGQAYLQTQLQMQGYTHPMHLQPFAQPIALSTSPMARHITSSKSSSPPAVSVRNARGRSHLRTHGQGHGAPGVSEGESTQGSSASSFSDLSDASFSASALESALMSNIRGGGSRLSMTTRCKVGGRSVRQ
ncbi:hypothetical protein SCLCIDRAFT_736279 [Scleroderma citrinum Foug A]|uniref:Uncharacterized protein n=1 Tax=Scleroderma citrinum Foug A TaxID=1036808 RepID=A0A0C2ZQ59_9AGAM|nr:hypothetical protein SCLCIDRAFT_736279 [Scleroderma citrinum Foug A]